MTACDTTSRIHGIGKSTALKMLQENPEFRMQASVFVGPPENKADIACAGEKAVQILYGSSGSGSIDELLYQKIKMKTATRITHVEPASLPQQKLHVTSIACVCSSVYHQVQKWKHFESDLDPTLWGWELNDKGLLWPVYTDKPIAPTSLLKS